MKPDTLIHLLQVTGVKTATLLRVCGWGAGVKFYGDSSAITSAHISANLRCHSVNRKLVISQLTVDILTITIS